MLIGYIYFQFHRYLTGPQITSINLPHSFSTTSPTIEMRGVLKNVDFAWLNGRKIYTNTHGEFKEVIALTTGYTIHTLSVKDRYGRQQQKVFNIFLEEEPRNVNELESILSSQNIIKETATTSYPQQIIQSSSSHPYGTD